MNPEPEPVAMTRGQWARPQASVAALFTVALTSSISYVVPMAPLIRSNAVNSGIFGTYRGYAVVERHDRSSSTKGSLSSYRSGKRTMPWRLQMAAEETEDYEMEMDLDTTKLDIFGGIITQVKHGGTVSASTNIVYDCSHSQWLLAQMAYDRSIRRFSCRSIKALSAISAFLPEDATFIFSGALHPKQSKRLLRMRGLQAVVAKDAKGPAMLDMAVADERERMTSKGLSRVSKSREKYLLHKGGKEGGSNEQGPVANVVGSLGMFMQVEPGEGVADLVTKIQEANEGCQHLNVVGLWGGSEDPAHCLELVEHVAKETGLGKLKVVLTHSGHKSEQWFMGLKSDRKGSVMWHFEYEV